MAEKSGCSFIKYLNSNTKLLSLQQWSFWKLVWYSELDAVLSLGQFIYNHIWWMGFLCFKSLWGKILCWVSFIILGNYLKAILNSIWSDYCGKCRFFSIGIKITAEAPFILTLSKQLHWKSSVLKSTVHLRLLFWYYLEED